MKNIWIIGASSGIGEALANELNDQGCNLILSARRRDKLEALNSKFDNKHTVIDVDVSDIDSLKNAVKRIKGIDCVIFLAAIYSPYSNKPKSIEFVHEMLNINLGGAFNTVYAVQDIFKDQGYGHIVLCGSVAGYKGLPNGQPYCATKAAIINYSESLKIELEPYNIKVQLVNPGFVKSPLTDKNSFSMPMIMETNDAAKALVNGLRSNKFEISFPKRFTFLMKLLKLFPYFIYFKLAKIMQRK